MKRVLFVLISLMLCLVLASYGSVGGNAEITLEEYNDIRKGMTYEDVCKIIGGKEYEMTEAIRHQPVSGDTIENCIEDIKVWIDKNEDYDTAKKEKMKNGLDELYRDYIGTVKIEDEASIDKEAREIWLKLQFDSDFSWRCNKYKWQGEKNNSNAEYRGYATIYFQNGIVVRKECKDLE